MKAKFPIGCLLLGSILSQLATASTSSRAELEEWLNEQERIVEETEDKQLQFVKEEVIASLTQEERESYGFNVFGLNNVPKLTGPSGLNIDEFANRAHDSEKGLVCLYDSICSEENYLRLDSNPLDSFFIDLESAIYRQFEDNDEVNLHSKVIEYTQRFNEILSTAARDNAEPAFIEDEKDQLIGRLYTSILDTLPDTLTANSKKQLLIHLSGNQVFNSTGLDPIIIKWRNRLIPQPGQVVNGDDNENFYLMVDALSVKAYAVYTLATYEKYFGEEAASEFYRNNSANDEKLLSAIMKLAEKIEYSYQPIISIETGIPESLPFYMDFSKSIGIPTLLKRSIGPIALTETSRETQCEQPDRQLALSAKSLNWLIEKCITKRLDLDNEKIKLAFQNLRSEFLYPPVEPSEFQKILNFAFAYLEIAGFVRGFKGIIRFGPVRSFRPRVSMRFVSSKAWMSKLRPSGGFKPKIKVSRGKRLSTHFTHYKRKVTDLQPGTSKIMSVRGKSTEFKIDIDGKTVAYQHYWGNRFVKYGDQGIEGIVTKNAQGQYSKLEGGLLGGGKNKRVLVDRTTGGSYQNSMNRFEELDGGHSADRHGPQVTKAELKRRVQQGIAADGVVSPTADSTRFLSSELQLKSRQRAFDVLQRSERLDFGSDFKAAPRQIPEGSYTVYIEYKKPIGQGYSGYGQQRTVTGRTHTRVSDGTHRRTSAVVHDRLKARDARVVKSTIGWDVQRGRWTLQQHFPVFEIPGQVNPRTVIQRLDY